MRGTPIVYLMSLAAALTLLAGSAVFAQLDEPIATAPPPQYDDLSMAIIENDLTQPAINAVIDGDRARSPSRRSAAGPATRSRRRRLPSQSREPARPEDVVLAARDAGEKGYDLVVISGGDSQATVGFANGLPGDDLLRHRPAPALRHRDGRADPSGTCDGGRAAIPLQLHGRGFRHRRGGLPGRHHRRICQPQRHASASSAARPTARLQPHHRGLRAGRQVASSRTSTSSWPTSPTRARRSPSVTRSQRRTFAEAFIDVYRARRHPAARRQRPRAASSRRSARPGILAVGDRHRRRRHLPGAGRVRRHQHHQGLRARRAGVDLRLGQRCAHTEWRLGLADGHVGVTDEWTRLPGLPVDLAERYAQAEQAVITGQVETCPGDCGAPVDLARPAGRSPAPQATPASEALSRRHDRRAATTARRQPDARRRRPT